MPPRFKRKEKCINQKYNFIIINTNKHAGARDIYSMK